MGNNKDEALVRENLVKKAKTPVNSDEALLYRSDTSNLSKHNKQYTELLKAYVKYFKLNSKSKHKDKEDLFKIAKGLLLGAPLFTVLFVFITLILLACGVINVLEILPGLITSLASLIGTFMVIPQMITEYLFNKEEEDHLAKIISKIQEYDRDIRDGM